MVWSCSLRPSIIKHPAKSKQSVAVVECAAFHLRKQRKRGQSDADGIPVWIEQVGPHPKDKPAQSRRPRRKVAGRGCPAGTGTWHGSFRNAVWKLSSWLCKSPRWAWLKSALQRWRCPKRCQWSPAVWLKLLGFWGPDQHRSSRHGGCHPQFEPIRPGSFPCPIHQL